MIENESLVITTTDRAHGRLTTRFYPVWDLVKPFSPLASSSAAISAPLSRSSAIAADFDRLIDILVANIASDSWDDVGGEGSIQGYKGMLVVSNTDEVHGRIEKLIGQLRLFPVYNESLTADNALSMAIGDATATIEQKLRKKTTVQFKDTSLADALHYFKDEMVINIEIDRGAFDDLGLTTDQAISLFAKDISLHSALTLMLQPIDLCYVVDEGYVLVTSPDKAAEKLQTRCHDVRGVVDFPDEFDSEQLDSEFRTLADVVVATIAPDTWAEVGGEGSISAFPRKGVIVCSNTLDVHNEIDAFLKVSRKVRANSMHSAPRDPNILGRNTTTTRIYIFDDAVKAGDIAEAIQDVIAPDSWQNDAFTKVVQNRLIVRNSRPVQNEIRSLMRALQIDVKDRPGGGQGGGYISGPGRGGMF